MKSNIVHLEKKINEAKENCACADYIKRLQGALEFAQKIDNKYILIEHNKYTKIKAWHAEVIKFLKYIRS